MSDETSPAPATAAPSPTLGYHTPSARPPKNRIGFLALSASIFMPGFGQLIARLPRRAACIFGIYLGLVVISLVALSIPRLVPALLFLMPLASAFQVWNWIDAFRKGRQIQLKTLGNPFIKYSLGVVLLAGGLIAPLGRLAALVVRRNFVEAYIIPTAGMSPTFKPKDRILVHRRFEPKRWDIVAFFSPQDPQNIYVQRLVGFPGEKIEIVKGIMNVNGQPLQSPSGVGAYVSTFSSGVPIHNYVGRPTGTDGDPIVLGPDEYFMLGDNSPVSLDSRYWQHAAPGHQPGTLPRSWMIGVATWIYWPPGHWKRLD